ncbi:MAG: methylated-DNA--[protein]-cysteine S-methyltransferase [Leptolyngbya sp. Prado105]|nr:methylated-DNA--[protein]-cysteine S-methyltransferase [Leptolyngbya sp. Prado105]
MSKYQKIYDVVRQIPYGQVATYGQVAELAGLPRQARLVGYALFRSTDNILEIPWHRVVNAKGEVSMSPVREGMDYVQRSRLEAEGIEFRSDRLSLNRHRWQPDLTQFG